MLITDEKNTLLFKKGLRIVFIWQARWLGLYSKGAQADKTHLGGVAHRPVSSQRSLTVGERAAKLKLVELIIPLGWDVCAAAHCMNVAVHKLVHVIAEGLHLPPAPLNGQHLHVVADVQGCNRVWRWFPVPYQHPQVLISYSQAGCGHQYTFGKGVRANKDDRLRSWEGSEEKRLINQISYFKIWSTSYIKALRLRLKMNLVFLQSFNLIDFSIINVVYGHATNWNKNLKDLRRERKVVTPNQDPQPIYCQPQWDGPRV